MKSYLSRNRVILIDRLDYLISKNSFASVLSLVQKLNDLVFMKKSIVLLSVDPRTLTEREFSLLQKETHPLQLLSKLDLSEDLGELLLYVAQRNEVGAKPSHKEIEKRFDITRTTVRKRLVLLHEKGLIVEKRKGRMKVVEITERGKRMVG
jgi:DNA-binding MarR family transcriptional regulator